METCWECGNQLAIIDTEIFHYTESGLDNVYLEGIIRYKCNRCGLHRSEIPDLQMLHSLIAVHLVFKKGSLTHDEIVHMQRIIRERGRHTANFSIEHLYESGPMVFRWTGREWQHVCTTT
jgi:YgiT-type zinc finger domain-containing protein